MPIISRFFGITIKIHWKDHNPPHFHALYEKYRATFDIRTGNKIEGRFPKTGEKIIREWAKQYRREILEKLGIGQARFTTK